MKNLDRWIRKLERDVVGQDMIEYALMAAFVAVAAAAVLPTANGGISTIFSKIGSLLTAAASS
jgi:pilus assembly protein Flp/PilA